MMKKLKSIFFVVSFVTFGGMSVTALGENQKTWVAASSDQLWNIVHGQCVPSEMSQGAPSPCESVVLAPDEAHGYAVLKDLVGASHFLLIPTAKITGVEDPLLLTPDARNYWSVAWQATDLVSARLHAVLAHDQLAIAVNPIGARSQNQLHVHIDCVDPDIRDLLKRTMLQPRWTQISFSGKLFLVRPMQSGELDSANPFKVVASEILQNASGMKNQAIALIGAVLPNGDNGFYLITSSPGQTTPISAELFLDRDCHVIAAQTK